MRAVLVGAGRMGLAHLRGLGRVADEICVVDPRPEAAADVAALVTDAALSCAMSFCTTFDDVGDADVAVLAETAGGRLERFELLAERGVRRFLIEKPVEQSRERVRRFVAAARLHGVEAHVNFVFRTLPLYRQAAGDGEAFRLTVTGGAFGLACNGIHFLDLGVFLSGGDPGRVVYAHVELDRIDSPRGSAFRDFGGDVLCTFSRGSTTSVASAATRAGPVVVVLERPGSTTIVEPRTNLAVSIARPDAIALPPYRYDTGYERHENEGAHRLDLPELTQIWAEQGTTLPTLEEAVPAHELLFDALETTGETHFAIT